MGAWIETSESTQIGTKLPSHPSWVRGLKLCRYVVRPRLLVSHPSWVRGLKLPTAQYGGEASGRTPRGCVD